MFINFENNINEALLEFKNILKAKNILKQISKVFPVKNYLIIEAFALRIYDKKAGKLTQDIDTLISKKATKELDNFLSNFKNINRNYFLDSEWIMISEKDIEIDIKIKSKSYEREALNNPNINIINYEETKLAVIKPEYLTLMKLETLRKKDEEDLITIFSWKFTDFEKLNKLVNKYLPHIYEDYEQLKLISFLKNLHNEGNFK